MPEQETVRNKTPKYVLSERNRRAMQDLVTAPSIVDLAVWPVEIGAGVLARDVLPFLFRTGEHVRDTVARAGSAIVDLARRN